MIMLRIRCALKTLTRRRSPSMSEDISSADPAPHDGPDSFRYRTSNPWFAAAAWVEGLVLSQTEIENGRAIFEFADSGDFARAVAHRIETGSAVVNLKVFREAFFAMRRRMDDAASSAPRTR